MKLKDIVVKQDLKWLKKGQLIIDVKPRDSYVKDLFKRFGESLLKLNKRCLIN